MTSKSNKGKINFWKKSLRLEIALLCNFLSTKDTADLTGTATRFFLRAEKHSTAEKLNGGYINTVNLLLLK